MKIAILTNTLKTHENMGVLENPKHEQFAQHYARFGNAAQAYVNAGYSENGAKQSAARLLTNADLRSRVEELRAEYHRVTLAYQLADRNERVKGLQDMADRLCRLVEARSKSPEMANVTGGDTGLVVADLKMIGFGENAQLVKEVRVDRGVLQEYREYSKQIAQEVGQWSDGRHTVEHEGTVQVNIADTTALEVAQLFLPHEIEAALRKLPEPATENS